MHVTQRILRSSMTLALAGLTALGGSPFRAQGTPRANPGQPAARSVPERPPILMTGESPDLMSFYTGDVIGYLTPCG